MGGNSASFFANKDCAYFPCHGGVAADDFNCLFCYCPLFFAGGDCGGAYARTESGVKDCTGCAFPHRRENYPLVIDKLKARLAL